jgi:hypothetical protein
MENNYLHTAEWKTAEDAIGEYFGEVLDLAGRQILTACKLHSAKMRNWTVKQLLAEENKSVEDEESSHWWTQWEGLLEHLEKKFSIHFPRKSEVPESFVTNSDDTYTKITCEGLNFEISSQTLSELVCILLAKEELDNKFFIYSYEPITKEEMLMSMPFSDSTKELTYQILKEMPVDSFLGGYCRLKSVKGEFGRITDMDAVGYKAILRDMHSDTVLKEYENFRELVEDGWVID